MPLTSPFDVTFTKEADNIAVVQPDIIIICDKDNLDDKGRYKGTPTLVVEVLSPSTRSKDMLTKLALYKQCGVSEYPPGAVINGANTLILCFNSTTRYHFNSHLHR